MVSQARSRFYSRATRYNNEYRIIHADGSTRWVQSIGQSVWDGDNFLWLDGLFIDITERKEAEARINYLTFRDSLTGLYNRNFFEEELKRLNVVRQLPTSFILGDLNGLKLINDSLGHQEGDKYLAHTAMAMQNSCRQDDIV